MPSVHVERVPVRVLGLGVLGFDHLQIVFRTDFHGDVRPQDDWLVIEGLREPDGAGLRLAVEGWHGGTTLSEANGGRTGEALVGRIGTADLRGAREIGNGHDAMALWADLVSSAADVEAQHFPYIALTFSSSPLPTLNSSSLIASLLHRAGIDLGAALPHGLRFSPGTTTLLGSSRDDHLQAGPQFSTIVAGDGCDELSGSDDPGQVDKLYGGRGDDIFRWSPGFNVVHGGQPGLAYTADGRDTIDYSGAGSVRLEAPVGRVAHLKPDFIATTPNGVDRLFSIEDVTWDDASDRLVIGKGVGLANAPLRVDLGREEATGRGDVLDLSESDVALSVAPADRGALRVSARDLSSEHALQDEQLARDRPTGVSVSGAEWIVGSSHGDRLTLAGGLGGVEGGAGNDTFVVRGPVAVAGGAGADRYVIADPDARLFIEDASPDDRVVLAHDPSRVSLRFDTASPRDLAIRVGFGGDDGKSAEIVVRDFHCGDLGLDCAHGIAFLAGDAGQLLLSSVPDTLLVEGLYGFSASGDASDLCGLGGLAIAGLAELPCLPPPS